MPTSTISARAKRRSNSISGPSAQTNPPVLAIHAATPSSGALEQDQTSPPAKVSSLTPASSRTESKVSRKTKDVPVTTLTASSESNVPEQAIRRTASISGSPVLEQDPYASLNFAAQVVDDLEALRIANANRLRQLTNGVEDSDGETRGLGFGPEHPSVISMASIVEGMEKLEAQSIKELERLMKTHPLGPWVKVQTGIGFKQAARLLGAIGDPYIRPAHELEDGTFVPAAPRTVSQLWAYSGYSVIGGESQRRRKGVQANWSDDARKRAYLIAASCVKQKPGTPWRDLYDASRAKYAESVHGTDCLRCGPKGKPAKAGTPLSAGHQHARALRIMSKELLKELWLESKRVHEIS